MDEALANTQDVNRNEADESFVETNVWGHLFPFNLHYPYTSLVDEHYTVGRQGKIMVPASSKCYSSISKIHFEIAKDYEKVLLTDKSANGTFVDGVLVGRNKSVMLTNNCEISIAIKSNKAYIFQNILDKEPPYPKEVIEKYIITKKIGSGAYGEVRLAFKRHDYEKLAVKIIEKKTFSMPGKALSIESEVSILKQLNHPCIIKFEDAIDTGDKLFIFMELVEGGELFDRVKDIKMFSDHDAKLIFYQLVLAIKYLHDNNISHRDIKPENILLSSAGNRTLIKVTDFGLSKFLDGHTVLKTMCGTPNYLAPEVLLCGGTISYTTACDMWSLGVVLFICLSGYPPFSEDRTDGTLKEQIIEGLVEFPRVFWKGVSPQAIDLTKRLLTVEPANRITVIQVLNHPWLRDLAVREEARLLMYPQEAVTKGGEDPLSGEPVVKKQKN